jgi:heavy metal translocating P-type ATPase
MREVAGKIKLVKLDKFLLLALSIVLFLHYGKLASEAVDHALLTFFASIATMSVLYSAYRALRNKKITVDLLAGVALAVSLLNYEWVSAVFINLMLTCARIFDAYTQNRARKAILCLLKLKPEKVKVKKGTEIVEEVIAKIKSGDLIIVELGERIPVDGIVIEGQAQVDQSSLTGESLPVNKNIGDEVLSSTLNVSGSLVIRAEKVGKDTTFEKNIRLVEQSQKDKAGIQTIADKFTAWYIAVTILGAVFVWIFSHNLNLVLSILLVTCADDIAVAIPMVFSAGISNAAKRGIIIKGGSFLEGIMRVKTIVVDKTGTLTKGKPKVIKIYSFGEKSEREIISLVAGVDFFSTHPIARAIIQYADEQKIPFEKTDKFEEFSGKGSHAMIEGKKVICGKAVFLEEEGVIFNLKQKTEIEKIKEAEYGSIILVAQENQLEGLVLLEDEIRPEVKETIKKIYALGIEKVIMLTGDNEKSAQKVAQKIGLTAYHAELLPEDKVNYVKKYLNDKHKVAMIGDGVNDAASLALADVGIAMGSIGTDAAIEAADIALMKDDFSKVGELIELGRLVAKISKQDFWIWGIINIGGLALVFFRIIGPEGSAAFNFITDFFPLLNSMRMFGRGFGFFEKRKRN